jgi:hypothetical protein
MTTIAIKSFKNKALSIRGLSIATDQIENPLQRTLASQSLPFLLFKINFHD